MNNVNPCFECGTMTTSRHHVVPISCGGRNTIPLCARCQSKVVRDSSRSEKIIAGLNVARARGVALGAPVKHCEPLLPLRNKGMSIREISERVNLSVGCVHNKLKKEIQDIMPLHLR